MVDGKRCSKCGETKSPQEFSPGKRWSDGLHPYCRSCKSEANKASWQKHGDRRRAEARARYAANPEPAKARRRKQYEADPQKAVAQAAAWNRANPDKRRVTTKRWQQANLQGKVRESTRRRYARRKGAPTIKFSPSDLLARAAFYGHRCWMCGAAMEGWDHVKPLAKGGWHCLSNLRPACHRCNASKNDAWPWPG